MGTIVFCDKVMAFIFDLTLGLTTLVALIIKSLIITSLINTASFDFNKRSFLNWNLIKITKTKKILKIKTQTTLIYNNLFLISIIKNDVCSLY